MRVPQISERIKEAPVVMLRGMLAGIGQVLLITDKIRNKVPAQAGAPEAEGTGSASASSPCSPAGAGPSASGASASASASPEASASAVKRDLDRTGNVRLIEEEPAETGGAAAAAAAAAQPEAAAAAEAEAPAAGAQPPAVAAAGQPASALPLDNYDELSVPSLRARLRNLTAQQVAALAEYERSHAARAEVISMFERRIAKLEAES